MWNQYVYKNKLIRTIGEHIYRCKEFVLALNI